MADSNKHDLEFYTNKERKKEQNYAWHMFNISCKHWISNDTQFNKTNKSVLKINT